MTILLDTNILTRLDHVGHPHRALARNAIERLIDEQHQLRTVPQVLYEYWVVVTRPAEANGLGFSTESAVEMLRDFKELFPPLRDERGILEPWEELIVRYKCQGKSAHDTRLVAAMIRHDIQHIVTFNQKDFARYTEITAVTPDAIVSGAVSL